MRKLRELKIARATETRSTCPYCSVSCGVIIYTIGDNAKNVTPQVIHVEGDPDHPINRGNALPEGSVHWNRISSTRGGSSSRRCAGRVPITGKTLRGTQAIDEIGHWVKKTRDETFR